MYKKSKYLILFIIVYIVLPAENNYTQSITISGFITDKNTGEALIRTNILVYKDSLTKDNDYLFGTATNNYGYYILPKLQKSKYFLIIRHLGYRTKVEIINTDSTTNNLRHNIDLEQEDIRLDEVIVKGKKLEKEILSTIDISPEVLYKLPTFTGEVDLFRALQLLPGINKASDLSNGLYVRGGSPDQTLTIVDGSIVYNPSHIGNLASTFNSNAISDLKLIKGAFPSEYGGRLSSVLDIKLRSGSKEKESGTVGLGLINSFFSFEGPLKDNSSYMVAGRWMYYDFLQKEFLKKSSVPLYRFFDLNGKLSYNLSETSAFSISAMYSQDKMYNPSGDDISYEIGWKNLNLTLNWIQINTNSIFLNSSIGYINYNFSSKIGIESKTVSSNSYYSNPNITDLVIRQIAEINWEINQKIKTGFELSFHNYDLLYSDYYDTVIDNDPYAGKDINSIEAAYFFQNESEFFDDLKTNFGARLYYYGDTKYFNIEPRISISYQLIPNFFIKTAAAQANQFLHLISRNDITLPTDLWYPSTKLIKPSSSWQYIFGLDSYFDGDNFRASIETYYRDMKHLYEFKNAAIFNPINNSLEEQLTEGRGESYGLELFLQKRSGALTGWIGYTLSWTKRKFIELNFGKLFYPKYDRRNDLSLTATYQFNDNLNLGATFTFANGLRYTLPPGQFIFNPIGTTGNDDIYLNYGKINESTFAPYHKLDISANYSFNLNKTRFNFFINLYNLYNRSNAYAQYVYYKTDPDGNLIALLKKISLFPFIPSFGVSISF